jgi:hypothetical protein
MPAADATTVESLILMTTGWSRWSAPGDDVVLDDLDRPWPLTEVVELVSPTVSVHPNPSVATTGSEQLQVAVAVAITSDHDGRRHGCVRLLRCGRRRSHAVVLPRCG